jgi:predicted transcriptional regulator
VCAQPTRKRKWVHGVNLRRTKFAEFHHLIKQLREDEDKFKEYFRMNTNQLDNLLSHIKDEIEKKKFNYRETISA